MNEPPPRDRDPLIRYAILGLAICGFLTVLHVAKDLVLPIVLAWILSLALMPFTRWLESKKIPRQLSSAFVLFLLAVGSVFILAQAYEPILAGFQQAPQTLRKVERKIRVFKEPVEAFQETAQQVEDLAKSGDAQPAPEVQVKEMSLSRSLVSGIQEVFVLGIVILFLTFFLLLAGDRLFVNLMTLLEARNSRQNSREVFNQVQADMAKYLGTITLINVILGMVIGFMAYLFGLPNPLVWGVLAGLLNYVPYLGSLVGVTLLAFASFIHFPTWQMGILPPLVYAAFSTLEGMFVTPLTLGKRFSLNPVVVFVWILLWGWLWGVSGALLAVPLLAVLKIFAEHWGPLGNVAHIISGTKFNHL